jgi:hypothetical protein
LEEEEKRLEKAMKSKVERKCLVGFRVGGGAGEIVETDPEV